MRLASIDQKDKKDEMLTPTQIQQQQMMQQEKGMGSQMLDMAKQRAMSSALDAGTTGLTSALSSSTPVVASGVEGGAMLGAGAGAGGAGMAALGTAMPYVGMGLMGAKLLGLFEHGGLVGPLSPQYNSKGTKKEPKPRVLSEELLKELDKMDSKGYPTTYEDLVGPVYKSEGTKPDFLDLDKDNNKTESMEAAAEDAKKKPQYNAEGMNPMMVVPMPMMRPVPTPMMKPNIMGMKYLQENPQDAAMSLEGYEPILDGSYINASPVMSEIDRMRADYLKSLGE